MKQEPRRPASADNLDIPPEHALGVSGSEGFHGRFLRRKPAGEVDDRIVTPCTVRDLPIGEDAVREPLAVASEGGGDAGDVGSIEPQTDDVHHG